jgi:hypothetical protein
MLVLQGDGNLSEDYPVPAPKILSKIVSAEQDQKRCLFKRIPHRDTGWIFIFFAATLNRILGRSQSWEKWV